MIEFRPLTEDNLPLVEEWLRREHVARWWRDDIRESLAEYRAARDVVTASGLVAAVEEESRRSWRAFEKAGFRYVREVEEDGLPHRLMRFDR